MSSRVPRQPHAVLNLDSRRLKGLKIERLLGLGERAGPIRLLEVGTGSGGIAHYFGTHPTLDCNVTAVDVIDQRTVLDGYAFVKVSGPSLPFADKSFDVVLTNHVIEHVGGHTEQLAHLKEVRRVMTDEGCGYLAGPNRWMLTEPHYRLPFLSWLPRRFRTPYLHLMRRGTFYDCEPLSIRQLDALLDMAGLKWTHIEIEAMRLFFLIENKRIAARIAEWVPSALLECARPVIPTLICRLARS